MEEREEGGREKKEEAGGTCEYMRKLLSGATQVVASEFEVRTIMARKLPRGVEWVGGACGLAPGGSARPGLGWQPDLPTWFCQIAQK